MVVVPISLIHLQLLERAVLRAGIASILEDYDKAIAILKEAETLRAELSSSIPSLPAINSPQEPSVEAKSIENVGIPGEESLLDPKLDNGKRKEYSYREKMAVCLVCLRTNFLD